MFRKVGGKNMLTMAGKNAISGYLFILPFVIGFLAFLAYPLYEAIRMAFSRVALDPVNSTFSMQPLLDADGNSDVFAHFRRAFLEDPDFTRAMVEEIGAMVLLVPAILVFSLFVAVLLNRKFPGRGFVRAVFFLPVILASGVLIGIESDNALLAGMGEQIREQNAIRAGVTGTIERMLENMWGSTGISDYMEYVLNIINQIYTIAMASGIQILIFLAGLQTINPSIYEAASIEGATGWENFWKITFPMISPMILVVVVYSIIDFMVRTDGEIMDMVRTATGLNEFGFSSAMAMSFFVIIAIILGGLGFIISRLVYYYD